MAPAAPFARACLPAGRVAKNAKSTGKDKGPRRKEWFLWKEQKQKQEQKLVVFAISLALLSFPPPYLKKYSFLCGPLSPLCLPAGRQALCVRLVREPLQNRECPSRTAIAFELARRYFPTARTSKHPVASTAMVHSWTRFQSLRSRAHPSTPRLATDTIHSLPHFHPVLAPIRSPVHSANGFRDPSNKRVSCCSDSSRLTLANFSSLRHRWTHEHRSEDTLCLTMHTEPESLGGSGWD
jgi:hypothetical protein